jgi:hypothetical protein
MRRRTFLTTAFVPVSVTVSGCSESSGGSEGDNVTKTTSSGGATPTATPTDRQTPTASDIPTASSEPDDEVADGLIETLADYEYVAKRPDRFVGTEISSGMNGNVKYYQEYGEEYQGFRGLFDEGTRPFFLKTDEGFTDGHYELTGTVEKIGELQDTLVIYVENPEVKGYQQ